MNTKVEQVARAMEAAIAGKDFLSWEEAARAAIEAMRVPTPGMLEAAFGALVPAFDANAAWQAMIDAALAEGKQC